MKVGDTYTVDGKEYIILQKTYPQGYSSTIGQNFFLTPKIIVWDSVAHLWGGKYGSFAHTHPGQLLLVPTTGDHNQDLINEKRFADARFLEVSRAIIQDNKNFELEQFLLPVVLESVGGVIELKANTAEFQESVEPPPEAVEEGGSGTKIIIDAVRAVGILSHP